MSEAAPSWSATTGSVESASGPMGLIGRYRQDHRNPINHFLHVGVGWPMVAAAVLLVPFRPLWSLALFLAGYAIMFFGHFVFERNVPTILKHPSTPFVVAFAVIREALRRLARLSDCPGARLSWKDDFPEPDEDSTDGHRDPFDSHNPHRPGRPRPSHDAGRVHRGRFRGRLALRTGERSR